jgi:glycosyltransferase involved in cell wall biosynthesis
MVIVADALSTLAKKGEFIPRYYNPGELFDEVHIVMTNDDKAKAADVQMTVGHARLYLYNVPIDRRLFTKTLGYRNFLLNRWAAIGVRLASNIHPDLVRCYGISFNSYLAARIKQSIGTPFVVSLHGNPDVDLRGSVATTFRAKLYSQAHKAVEAPALKYADHFIVVYTSVTPYLQKHQVRNFSLIYNAVGYTAIQKADYQLRKPLARFLCVGRQESLFKDPTNIVQAIAELPEAELIMIGTGDLHERLKNLAQTLKCQSRCKFIPALPNEQVLAAMRGADIYVFNQISLGISKTIIEAALTGLPIIVNARPMGAKDELSGDWLSRAEDSKDGYLAAMKKLLHDKSERERLGRSAYSYARKFWAPDKLESQVVEVYRKVMRYGHGEPGKF